MRKNTWLIIFVLVVLAGVYVFYFTSLFKSQIIHISSTSRTNRWRTRNNRAINPYGATVAFSLTPECKVTEITVVPLATWETNKNVLPVWHLVTDGDAYAIKIFTYGQNLRGLKPAMPGAHADPLEPDITYRLFLTAGKAHGEHDFEIKTIN